MTEHDSIHIDETEAAEADDYAPPKAPQPKVQAAGIAGAATIVAVFVLSLLGVEVPQTVAAALTTLLAVGAGYLRTE